MDQKSHTQVQVERVRPRCSLTQVQRESHPSCAHGVHRPIQLLQRVSVVARRAMEAGAIFLVGILGRVGWAQGGVVRMGKGGGHGRRHWRRARACRADRRAVQAQRNNPFHLTGMKTLTWTSDRSPNEKSLSGLAPPLAAAAGTVMGRCCRSREPCATTETLVAAAGPANMQ